MEINTATYIVLLHNTFFYVQYFLYERQKNTDHADYNAGYQKHDATSSF